MKVHRKIQTNTGKAVRFLVSAGNKYPNGKKTAVGSEIVSALWKVASFLDAHITPWAEVPLRTFMALHGDQKSL